VADGAAVYSLALTSSWHRNFDAGQLTFRSVPHQVVAEQLTTIANGQIIWR
jgi:hypothetical protein